MNILFFALLAPSASAAPVVNGVQAQIHPAGFAFLSRELTGSPWSIDPPGRLVYEDENYQIIIDNPNVEMQFGDVTLASTLNRLLLDAEIATASGRDMSMDLTISGIPISTTIAEYQVSNLRITGQMFPQIFEDGIDIRFLEPLQLDGDLDVDLVGIATPIEDGALTILRGTLLDFMEAELQRQLPELLAELTIDGFLYQSEIAGVSFGVTPSLIGNSDEGLFAAASIDLGGDGGPGNILDLGPRNRSHLAVGLTEAMVEEVAVAAWAGGLITPDSEATQPLFAELLEGLGLGGDLQVQLGTNVAPRVQVGAGGMRITLPGTELTVTNATGQTLLSMDVDLEGLLELKVIGGSLRLTAHELTADVTRLEASRLLEGGPENLEGFLEGWAIRAAGSAIDDLELYRSHFEALGYVLRIDESRYEDQALMAWATLFAADDPAVDRTPPDTKGQVRLDGNVLNASFSGTDDRPGELVFSYRVNEGSWSSWSSETEVSVAAQPGANRFEVKARDEWHNEDPTPAAGTVERFARQRRCGCTPVGSSGAAGLPGFLLGLLFLYRRHCRQR